MSAPTVTSPKGRTYANGITIPAGNFPEKCWFIVPTKPLSPPTNLTTPEKRKTIPRVSPTEIVVAAIWTIAGFIMLDVTRKIGLWSNCDPQLPGRTHERLREGEAS